MKLPPGKHEDGISEPLKNISQTPLEVRDPPFCAYLNGKTTLRPWSTQARVWISITYIMF